jgi:RNA polymerase sigma-70 factor (ECF subfamily)
MPVTYNEKGQQLTKIEKLLELIIKGCIDNDRQSQKELYGNFYSYAMSICIRYTGNQADAIEVLNDGFLKVFLNIKKFDIDKPFKPWLRRILVNSCLDHIKKNAKHNQLADISEAEVSQSTLETPDHNLNYEEILTKIGQLSPGYRAVFNLYVIDGYKHSDIASLLGITESTSKSNLTRAKAILRAMLEREEVKYG